MKYVLDSGVALRWVLPGPHAAKALQLRMDFQNQIHELLAPEVFIGERPTASSKPSGRS